jgi:DNA mismatch repair protein MutS2
VSKLALEARLAAHRTSETRHSLDETVERLERREKEIEAEGRKRIERYLLDARRSVEAEVERLRQLHAAVSAGSPTETRTVDAAVRETRAGIEQLLRESRVPDAEAPTSRASAAGPLVVGEGVRSRSLAVEGELLEIRGQEAVLESGGMRFTLTLADLEPTGHTPRSKASNPASPLPEIAPATEIDMRGLRVEEVEGALSQGLDAAFVNDVPRLRIIHGKGTGALRQEVARVLDGDGRVQTYRLGGFQEGGSGVTVVEFVSAIN